jgi:FO synthase
VKLGDTGTQAMLDGGANDLGGTLMEETISRMAGSGNGSLKTIAELEAMAAGIGRPARQRTTEYGTPSDERMATARSDAGRRALTLKLV